MPAWPPPSGSACSRRGWTPATSACCRSAAPAGCTPSPSRRSSGSTAWCSPPMPARSRPAASSLRPRARPGQQPGACAREPGSLAAARPARRCGSTATPCSSRTACRRRAGLARVGRHALPRAGLRAGGALAGAPRRGDARRPCWRDFHALHRQRFSYANPDDAVEIVTLRLTATGSCRPSRAGGASCPPRPRRAVAPVFVAGRWQDGAVHRRARWPAAVAGPAVIEEDYTTSSSPPAGRARPGRAASCWPGAPRPPAPCRAGSARWSWRSSATP